MSYVDLKDTLADWPFEPEKISVRKILGTDGVVRLQMRVELGVIQMETVGRPDGQRPGGFDSLLSRHKTELLQYEACNGTTLGFSLSPEESIDLRNEASLFYRRYVALFVLETFTRAIDTLGETEADRDRGEALRLRGMAGRSGRRRATAHLTSERRHPDANQRARTHGRTTTSRLAGGSLSSFVLSVRV